MPKIHEIKRIRVKDWLTQELFEKIFPYYKGSSAYSHDGQPFWSREALFDSIDWLNGHPNSAYHGFGESSDIITNKYEVAAFLANTHQETGDPSLSIPYPWAWPKPADRNGPEYGSAGGLLAIMEGVCASVGTFPKNGNPPFKGVLNGKMELNSHEKYLIGTDDDMISGVVMGLNPVNQLSFGLGAGTGGGVVFQPGLCGVSDDGTIYGDEPRGDTSIVRPSSEVIGKSKTDRKFACLGPYCQYGGRGAIQLSYNFNYSDCSIDLFNDYRLIRFPNLIVTTDRIKFNGMPEVFGFPGENEKGNNQLPKNILDTTPPARMMAWLTCLWFWMIPRSGRQIGCHEAMMKPEKYGITSVNIIVNNDSGCRNGTWAWNKNRYYERICAILGLPVQKTIVCPPAIK
jgi:hypothetical protein